MGYLALFGSTVIKFSPDKSEIPFLNFPKTQNAEYCLNRQKKHCSGIFKPIFLYKIKSPKSITNSFLQSTHILLISVFVFIQIYPGRTQDAFAQFVSFLNYT